MRIHWFVIAGFAGAVAATTVGLWPPMPLWRDGRCMDSEVVAFSRDNRLVYTLGYDFNSSEPTATGPHLCRWDAATGQLLGTVVIPFPPRGKHYRVNASLSPDESALLVGFENGALYPHSLYDARTGERRAGPIKNMYHVRPRCFSPDGRWFWIEYGAAPQPSFDSPLGLEILDATSGKAIVELPHRAKEKAEEITFAPNGTAAAVHWKETKKAKARHFVEIVELPSGRLQRRFELPGKLWEYLREWKDNRLYVEKSIPVGAPSNNYVRQSYSVDLTADSIDPPREEPLLHIHVTYGQGVSYYEEGSDWVAYLQCHSRESTLWDWVAPWLYAQVGTKYKERGFVYAKVRVVDRPSGQVRYEFPAEIEIPCVISNDGRRVACVNPQRGLEIWDASAPPRWPGMLAAGGSAALTFLFIGYWRSQRSRRDHSPLCRTAV